MFLELVSLTVSSLSLLTILNSKIKLENVLSELEIRKELETRLNEFEEKLETLKPIVKTVKFVPASTPTGIDDVTVIVHNIYTKTTFSKLISRKSADMFLEKFKRQNESRYETMVVEVTDDVILLRAECHFEERDNPSFLRNMVIYCAKYMNFTIELSDGQPMED